MFSSMASLPIDPILGLMAKFREDPNSDKVDLSVGVYKTANGHTPIFEAVKAAEKYRLETEDTKAYIGMMGTPGYNDAMLRLLIGADYPSDRIAAALTPGGCGALRVASEFLMRANPDATVWVSDPTWANHMPLIGGVGLKIKTYPYYDKASHGVNFSGMIETLKGLGPNDVVLLHASCHNPSGADLSPAQWDEIAAVAAERGFIPFIDSAYQGLGEGLDADAYGIRKIAASVEEMILASSCSKNFGLYRDRVGQVAVMTKADRKEVTVGQISSIARGMYSMPPAHGGAVVEHILTTPSLTASWQKELAGICSSIQTSRTLLKAGLEKAGVEGDFAYLIQNQGMFSFLDLTVEQINKLQADYSVYLVNSGRINLAGVTANNIDYLAASIKSVTG
ncbi:amino acid aminotransferase [Kordiimonas pumila]|uniref:Aminotransferase n=1 Tax=Kordiimonas pumila TaxID=2161677 RepID=A0ABV7D5A6_9PROT|nr:amino acid aminotransferase [Kordiimonas pumila]